MSTSGAYIIGFLVGFFLVILILVIFYALSLRFSNVEDAWDDVFCN